MRKYLTIPGGLALALVVGGFFVATPPAKSGGFPLPATEVTQLLNYATLIKQLAQQIQTYETIFQQWQQMVIDGQNLMEYDFTPVEQDLVNLSKAVNNSFGSAYALSEMDVQFNQLYQPFIPVGPNQPYYNAYQTWYYGAQAIIEGVLKRAGINVQAINDQQGIIDQIKNLATTSIGRNQAIDVGNVISSAMLDQLHKLQVLAASDMQQKAAIAGYELSKDQAEATAADIANQHVDRDADQTAY